MLTADQVKRIRDVVEHFHTLFIAAFIDPSVATAAEVKELKRLGIIAETVTLSSFPEDAYLFSRDRKSTRLNSSHIPLSRMPSSA